MRRGTLVVALLLVLGLGAAWVLAVRSAQPDEGGSVTLPAVTVAAGGSPGPSSPPPSSPSRSAGPSATLTPVPPTSPGPGASDSSTGGGAGSGTGGGQHGTPARGNRVPDPQPQRGG